MISIHAPSRERLQRVSIAVSAAHFNPRSLAGATLSRKAVELTGLEFQSTLPRGSDCYQRGR